MKTFWTILAVAVLSLYFTGFLAFGSWRSAVISIGLIAVVASGIGIAFAREEAKLRKQARVSGRSVTSYEHDGIRVYHPNGSQEFHPYK